ncbi:hypothetical protein EHQ67_18375 [Leptospira kmetyi]|nr:hypothetical protein EHQ67_18375 [Leptospira kmetyi]
MSFAKQQALDLIEKLPDDSSFDDIMEELFFSKKVQEGLSDLDGDKTVPHEQVVEEITQWRKR